MIKFEHNYPKINAKDIRVGDVVLETYHATGGNRWAARTFKVANDHEVFNMKDFTYYLVDRKPVPGVYSNKKSFGVVLPDGREFVTSRDGDWIPSNAGVEGHGMTLGMSF